MSNHSNDMRRCSHCGRDYPATREYFGSQPNGNLRRKCRVCVRNHVANYSRDNPLASAERAANRANRGGGHWSTIEERQRLFAAQGGVCVCCGSPLKSAIEAHVDHMTPIARGGKDILSNVSLVHERCNLEKHNKNLQEHWQWRVKVGLDTSVLTWSEINQRKK